VILQRQYEVDPILFSNEKVSSISHEEFAIHIQDPNVWYIVEGWPQFTVCVVKQLVCSPCKEHYKEFTKRASTSKRYMPTWTLKEIQTSRQVCFPHLDENEVKKLYDIWVVSRVSFWNQHKTWKSRMN